MKKRWLSFALVVAMAATFVPVIGSAEDVDAVPLEAAADSDGFSYEQKLLEDEQQSSTRFIVKYKDSAQGEREELIASSKEAFRQLKAEKENRRSEWEKHIPAERLERMQPQRKAKVFAVREVTANPILEAEPEVEIIELAESVNAEQFVAKIEDTMGDRLAYIQEDVQLETSSIDTASIVSTAADREANLSQAHQAASGEGVTIALIDGAVDIAHTDLQGHLVSGWDFFNDAPLSGVEEDAANAIHGTHVAGIIVQTAPGAKIMPLKVFEYGKAYTSDIIRAIEYAEANGADIVNCSWGNSAENPALKEAMENADLFFVAAAGNSRANLDETPVYPASYGLGHSISVTSVNQDDGMSYYSNYGESVDIAAWGRDVYSALPNNEHGNKTGTSMSAGYVTGAAALAMSCGVDKAGLKAALKSGAEKASSLVGKVDGGNLLNFASSVYGITPQDTTIVEYEDDFDKWAEKTPEETWQLFQASENVNVMGDWHKLLLKADGTVWAWGYNVAGMLGDGTTYNNGSPKPVIGLNNVKKIVAGFANSFAIKEDGTVWAWGYNGYGQLGDGTKTNKTLPVQVFSEESVKDISAGETHIVLLLTDGTVKTIGENWNGQLGDGTEIDRTTLVTVQNLSTVRQIGTGYHTSFALKEDGTVWAWGCDDYGSFVEPKDNILIPEQVQGLNNIVELSVYNYFRTYTALSDDGRVWTWDFICCQDKAPSVVNDLFDVQKIVSRDNCRFAMKTDGTVWGWGNNYHGGLGIQTEEDWRLFPPTAIEALNHVRVLGTGVAIDSQGDVLTWGTNEYGQLGNGYDGSVYLPVQLSPNPPVSGVKRVFGSLESLLGFIFEDNTMAMWGSNRFGKMGVGVSHGFGNPTRVQDVSDIKDVSLSAKHTLMLKNDGTVWACGNNAGYALGNGTVTECYTFMPVTGATGVKKVVAGNVTIAGRLADIPGYSLALKEDGTVLSWGAKSMTGLGSDIDVSTPTTIPGLNGITRLTAFGDNAFALKENGKLYAWGDISTVPLEITTLENVKEIYALSPADMIWQDKTLLVLKTDGTVWKLALDGEAVGSYTQIDNMANITEVIVSYNGGVLALNSNGEAFAYGHQYFGELGTGEKGVHFYDAGKKLRGIENIKSVAFDLQSGYFLKQDGSLWACGNSNSSLMDWQYLGQSTIQKISLRYINSVEKLPTVFARKGTSISNIPLRSQVSCTLIDGTPIDYSIVWDTSNLDINEVGTYNISAEIQTPDDVGNIKNLYVDVNVNVVDDPIPYVSFVDPLEDIRLKKKTDASALNLPSQVKVRLDNDMQQDLNVTWDTSTYNPTQVGEQTIYGTLSLIDGIKNPNAVQAEIKVIVPEPPKPEITSIPPLPSMTMQQYMPLGPTDESHALGGVPNTVDLPGTVGVVLDKEWNETTTPELPVVWDVEAYRADLPGNQTITGVVQCPEGLENPDDYTATVEIAVIPAECYLWEVDSEACNIEVYPTTTIEEINEMLGEKKVAIYAEYTEGDFAGDTLYIYSPFSVNKDAPENVGFQPDTPGYTYTLLADLPENIWDFYGFSEDDPSAMKVNVHVTVKEPLAITAVEDAFADTYQCLPLEDERHTIPTQVKVTLEDGSTEMIDVEWNTASYNPHVSGSQFMIGTLKNLPKHVKQPDNQTFTGKLIVTVQPVNYKITEVLRIGDTEAGEDIYETYAGLTLPELVAAIDNSITVQLQSTTEGIDISTEHELAFALAEDKNPQYEPYVADLYILEPTLALPDNISNPDNLFAEVMINTNAVNASPTGEVENTVVNEGTAFADITLPETVRVQLSNGKAVELEVDWGDGGNYTPYPPNITPESPVEFEITGSFVNLPQYINIPEFDPVTKVTVIYYREYNIQSITPSRIPETGELEVNLGSSLTDIYNGLETRTVTIQLVSNRGEEVALENVPFALRAEENSHYDPMTLNTYELVGYLALEENIKNPDGLQVIVAVKTMSYTISSAKAVRVTGVIAGTPFAEVPFPDVATATYTTGKKEDLPVQWIEGNYNPNKIGSQAVKGNFTPLPVHVQNPNNRQVSAAVTIVNPTVRILAATQVMEPATQRRARAAEEALPGFVERKYEVELQHQDGSITTEVISAFEEIAEE